MKGRLAYPNGIEVNSQDIILVNDLSNQRISFFDTDGAHIREWNATGPCKPLKAGSVAEPVRRFFRLTRAVTSNWLLEVESTSDSRRTSLEPMNPDAPVTRIFENGTVKFAGIWIIFDRKSHSPAHLILIRYSEVIAMARELVCLGHGSQEYFQHVGSSHGVAFVIRSAQPATFCRLP